MEAVKVSVVEEMSIDVDDFWVRLGEVEDKFGAVVLVDIGCVDETA